MLQPMMEAIAKSGVMKEDPQRLGIEEIFELTAERLKRRRAVARLDEERSDGGEEGPSGADRILTGSARKAGAKRRKRPLVERQTL